eukprot:1910806-Karenia_brevis.AAC.1
MSTGAADTAAMHHQCNLMPSQGLHCPAAMHHQHSLSSTSSVELHSQHLPAMHHQSNFDLDGRRRRRLGKQRQQRRLQQQQQHVHQLEAALAALKAENKALQTQCGHLVDLLADQFTAGYASPVPAGHPSPVLFEPSSASP